MYIERRRLESRALDTMKDIILGNAESFRPAAEERNTMDIRYPGYRSTVQFGMNIYDLLDIIQKIPPRRLRGAPEEADLACERPISPWKGWAMYLKGLVLRHDAINRRILMKDNPEEMTFERTLAGLSGFYGVSYVEVGGTVLLLWICSERCRFRYRTLWIHSHRNVVLSSCLSAPENPAELRPDDVAGICGFMRSKGFTACRTETFPCITKDRIRATDKRLSNLQIPLFRLRISLPTPFYLRPGSESEYPHGVSLRVCRDLQEVRRRSFSSSSPRSRHAWRGVTKLLGGRLQFRDTSRPIYFNAMTFFRLEQNRELYLSRRVRPVRRALYPGSFACSTGEQT